MYFHPGVTVKVDSPQVNVVNQIVEDNSLPTKIKTEEKSTKTTIPFVKNNEFDYA